MEKKLVSFRVDKDTYKKLKFIAVEHEKSLTDLFFESIKDVIKKYEKKAKTVTDI